MNQLQPRVDSWGRGCTCREQPLPGEDGGRVVCHKMGGNKEEERMTCTTGPFNQSSSDASPPMKVQPTVPSPSLVSSRKGGIWERVASGGVLWQEGAGGTEGQPLAVGCTQQPATDQARLWWVTHQGKWLPE